jgi:PPP family 3-phenylpropionic acid transporter
MTPQAVRFATYYGAFYLTLGAFLPYFPIWYEGQGLSAEWIGWIGAAGLAGRTLVAPFGAKWSDGATRQRDPIRVFALATVFVFGLHSLVDTPWVLVVLSFFVSAAFFGQIPLVDAFAMRESRTGNLPFGPVRAIGSAMFILANVLVGAMLDRAGVDTVLIFLVLGASLIAVAAIMLPAGTHRRQDAAEDFNWVQIGRLIRGPFGLALAASACVQGAHGFYYFFSAIAWTEQGHSRLIVGTLWATGVAIEIVFLWWSGRGALQRLKPATLLGLGAAASIVRWGFMALSPPLAGLFALQLLHALTYAATYIGFLRFAVEWMPERQTATVQAMNAALSGGIVMALASAASGYFYARIGISGFALMILPSALGLGAAIALHRISSLPPRQKLD